MIMDKIFGKNKKTVQRTKTTGVVLIIFSSLALIASFVLSYEKIHLLENPNADLSCSFNLVFNCATVMQTEEASVLFDVPNSFIGMLGFSAALALAVVMATGTKLPKWMYGAMTAAFFSAWMFALWLFFSSVYGIQVLCPWCLVITATTTILFAAMVRFVVLENVFELTHKWFATKQGWFEKDYDKFAVATIFVVLIALVILKFGDALFA